MKEPLLSTNILVGDDPPKAPTLPQYNDAIEVILDNRLIMSTTSIT